MALRVSPIPKRAYLANGLNTGSGHNPPFAYSSYVSSKRVFVERGGSGGGETWLCATLAFRQTDIEWGSSAYCGTAESADLS